MKIAFCSPLRSEKDGIGVYSRELFHHLSRRCSLEPFFLDRELHPASHFARMAEAVNRCDVLHVEHNYCYFNELSPLRETFRDFLRRVRIPRIVMYHELVERFAYVPRQIAKDDFFSRCGNAVRYLGKVCVLPAVNSFWLRRYNRDIFSIPERVVVHSEFRAGIIRRYAPNAKISVLPHPVYVRRERVGMEGGGRAPSFHREDVVLTIFGFINHRKDYISVLKTLAGLPSKYKLLIAGGVHDDRELTSPSSMYGNIMEFVNRHGLQDRVHISGYFPDDDLPGIMAETDVVIAPFTEDHCSGSINLGLAYSRPVVAFRTLLTEEMNRIGAGLIEVSGTEQLLSVLGKTETDPDLYRNAVRRGEEYSIRFGFPATADIFAAWYEGMLGKKTAFGGMNMESGDARQ